MNTRELLEKAAMAAGEIPESWYGCEPYFDGVLSRWNPLENDGDAFGLLCSLRLDSSWYPSNEAVCVEPTYGDSEVVCQEYEEYVDGIPSNGNRASALRLAITRAAAAMWDARQERLE